MNFRRLSAAAVLAVLPAIAAGQSAPAPLLVTATVVRSCRIEVPRATDPTGLATVQVSLTCARHSVAGPRFQTARRTDARGAVVQIDF